MGRVDVRIKVSNWFDVEKLAVGETDSAPRSAEVEAMVDAGAVRLYPKASVIRDLGLRHIDDISSRTMANVTVQRRVFTPVDLEINGRSGRFGVVAVSGGLLNIVGQIPLEELDWGGDCQGQKLIPNPEHKHGELCDDF